MNQLIETLNQYFGVKAPQLPANIKEIIVKFGPYLIIIGLIFTVLSIIALVPLMLGTAVLSTYVDAYAGISIQQVYISIIFGIIIGIIELMALPGLFKRTPGSWKLLFYAELVSLLSLLVSLNIISLIISGIVGLYILFQIRPLYNGSVPTSSVNSGNAGVPPTPPTQG